MTTQIVVDSKLQDQLSTSEHQLGVINPSRSITSYDEVYLRNYTLAAEIISWDEGVFGTPLQVTAADITNICITGDTVWYQINYYRGIPLNIEIFHGHRQWIQLYNAQLDGAEQECQPLEEPVGFAGDSVTCQLQQTQSALAEFEQGRHHGQQDASERLHPIYTKARCNYSSGYLEGYNSVLNPQKPTSVGKQTEWTVTYDPKWQWYQAWVGDRFVGRGTTHQEAEQIAQRYIATDEMIRRQNRAVLQAYAG